MSSPGQNVDDTNDNRSRSRRQPQPRPTTHSLITFVDTNAPNVRSMIQQHTARHSVAQRRAARLAPLRNRSRPRILEWSRRPEAADNDSTRMSTPSVSDVEETPVGTPLTSPTQMSEILVMSEANNEGGWDLPQAFSMSDIVPTEEAGERVIDNLLQNICRHAQSNNILHGIVGFARTSEVCLQFLLAYSIFLRVYHGLSMDADGDRQRAGRCVSSGTNLLLERLRYTPTATTEESIQAVLLLIAITADFGNREEISVHWNALRRMLTLREHQPLSPMLRYQLDSIGQAYAYHLTLPCTSDCTGRPRFSEGI